MSSTRMVEVTLEGIEEGEFMRKAETQFREAINRLIKFSRKHTDVKSPQVGLTMTVKVTEDDGMFSITTGTKIKEPDPPTRTTAVLAAESDLGGMALFMQRSGTSEGDPRQKKFATADGRDVDPKTGEVIPDVGETEGNNEADDSPEI